MSREQYSSVRALLNGAPATRAVPELEPLVATPLLKQETSPMDRRRKIDFLADALREKQTKRKRMDPPEKIPQGSTSEAVPLPVETECQTSNSTIVSLLTQTPTNVVQPIRMGEDLRSLLEVSEPFSLSPMQKGGGGAERVHPPAQELTAPKLSRHNDAAYYPNIQCVLCQEWVCSRNRYMHIESHLQYRPYRCSQCGYDNRKEIFINLHIKRSHKGVGNVVYNPNADLEHRAWIIAEQCLQHTRKVLMNNQSHGHAPPNPQRNPPSQRIPSTSVAPSITPEASSDLNPSLLESYETAYRPKIFNSQRLEKSQLIEESRQLGLVPDFSEVANREEHCRTCGSHILRHHGVLEEHVRTHLPMPTYLCNIDGCKVEHHSKNFISRHMKEVHKYRRAPLDLIEDNSDLIREFQRLCQMSFPEFFDLDTVSRIRFRLTSQPSQSNPPAGNPSTTSTGSVLSALLSRKASAAPSPELKTSEFRPTQESQSEYSEYSEVCSLCEREVSGHYSDLYDHVKTHLKSPPYQCSLCGFSGPSKKSILLHIFQGHQGSPESAGSMVRSGFTSQVRLQCDLLMKSCFPSVLLKPNLHDSVEQMGFSMCNLCQKGVELKEKSRHAELHLMQPILKCHYCPFKHSIEAAMNQHTRSEHKSDLYLIATPSASTNRASQIEIMMDECFVKKH